MIDDRVMQFAHRINIKDKFEVLYDSIQKLTSANLIGIYKSKRLDHTKTLIDEMLPD